METTPYKYVCEDKSVLYPILKKYLWAPILPYLPEWLSPNTLTIWGSFFTWVGFALCLILQPEDSVWFFLPGLCFFLYMSFDNMDGMQARRAGRSSPLGEFLDHWGDGFNTGLVIFGYGVALKTEPWFLAIMLSLVVVAYFSCFWEQQVTGKLSFGVAGSVEGVVYVVLMFMLVTFFGHEPICTRAIVGPLSLSNLMLLSVCLVFVLTIVSAWQRVGQRVSDYAGHAIALGGLGAWYAASDLSFVAYGFMVVFASAHLGGRVVIARVLQEPFKVGDPILYFLIAACAGVSLGAGLGVEGQTIATAPVLAYCVYRLGTDFARTVTTLRHHLVERELLERLFPRA